MLHSLLWVAVWATALHFTAAMVGNFWMRATGRNTQNFHGINILIPALLWAIIIVFFFN